MKVRRLPPNLQKGLSAFTTPAPLVQRLPTPPANETTATVPARRASPPIAGRHAGRVLGWRQKGRQARIGNPAAHGQAILRQADPAGAQVGLNLLVFRPIEPVRFQEGVEALRTIRFLRAAGSRVLEDVLHHALKFRLRWQAAVESFS